MAALPMIRPRVVIGVLVVAVLLALGALLVRAGQQSPPIPPPNSAVQVSDPRPAVPTGVAGPVTERAGVPVGYAHDEGGAVAAALAYVAASQRWLYFDDNQITEAIHEIASPAAADRLTSEVLADVGEAREQLGASPGRVWWLVRPLAWQVDRYDSQSATVSAWAVTVLSAQQVAVPQSDWVTVTVSLVWSDGDWRVDGVRDTPGPTPINSPKDQPSDAVRFDDALAGFTRLDSEPNQ